MPRPKKSDPQPSVVVKPAASAAAATVPARFVGEVVLWRAEGYGFARERESNLKVYVHCSQLPGDVTTYRELQAGALIEYEHEVTHRGIRAQRITILSQPDPPEHG
jgi:cold shock CspA family protein